MQKFINVTSEGFVLKLLRVLSGYLLLVVLPVLSACAGIDTGRTVAPVKLQIAAEMSLPFKADKVMYDPISTTFYIMEQNRPNIYFYRNNNQVNKIGGFGIEKINFQKLSDIAIDPDGNLLALDEFGKIIRKYSRDGKWIADIDLSSFNQPSRFCSTPESDLIVYDNATRELKRISAFDGKIMFSFGKFQIESVSGLTASRDYVAIVNDKKGKTMLFSAMGLYLRELDEQVVVDMYQNQYAYQDGAVKLTGSDLIIPVGNRETGVKLVSSGQYILVIDGENIITIKPQYQDN